MISQPGRGKTHLAAALGIQACQMGKKVRFYRVSDLITQLLEAREEKLLIHMKKSLSALELLVLDELVYVPASKAGGELFFDVISQAYIGKEERIQKQKKYDKSKWGFFFQAKALFQSPDPGGMIAATRNNFFPIR